ncbi:TonB-dependent receptor family protein [Wenyingzhuangia sp. IMCC45533]
MKLKVIKLLMCFCCTLNWAYAQNVSFEVLDQETLLPVSEVQIITKKGRILGLTDKKGLLTTAVNSSKQYIYFIHPEYKILEREFLIENNITLKIYLNSATEKLSEVVLRAKKKEIYALTALKPVEGTHIYEGKKSEVINLDLVDGNKSSNNARQIFSKVAGLNIYDSNDGGLQLNIGGRGLDPNRTSNFNTRQNDYDISADVLGYPESYYTPPSESLEKIQVIRGAASLQYGTQFGGLINFITHKPSYSPIEFTTRNTVSSFNTYTNFTSLSGTKGKFSYYTYYNFKKGDGFRPNSEYESNNFFIHLGYQFSEKTHVEFEYTLLDYLAHQPGGLSDVQFLEDPTQSYLTRNWFDVNWNLFNLKFNHEFNANNKITFSVFALNASRNAIGFRGDVRAENPNIFLINGDAIDEDGNFVDPRDLIVNNFKNWGTETRFLSNYQIGGQDSYLLLGLKTYKSDNDARQGAGSTGTDADFNFIESAQFPNQNNFDFPNFNTSIFGENIFNITDKFSVTPGFRFEHITTKAEGTFYNASINKNIPDNNSLTRNFVLLGLGLSYKPNGYLESYANFSQNYRSVTFSDIRTVNPTFKIDENIADEEGYTFDVGIRGKLKKAFSYDLNVFTLLYDNRIGQAIDNRAQFVRTNIGKANIVGFESLLQWNLKETFFKNNKHLTLDIYNNLSLTSSEYIESEVSGVKGNQVEFIPFYNLKTGIHLGWKNALVGLQYSFVDEQFTDASNTPYDPDNSFNTFGAIPGYDILDLTTSYKFSKNFKLEAGVNNLLDNSYFTRRATGYPGPGIIPAAPRSYYATLEIKF